MGLFDLFKNKKTKTKKRYGYEGASKRSRLSGWLTGNRDANAILESDLSTLRERSRDLRRNNPYAKKLIEVTTNNVVGKGIMTRVSGNDTISAAWKEWADTTACDFDGMLTLKGLQRLTMDTVQESGEVLVRRRITMGLKYPIQLQVLEPDFLAVSTTMPSTSGHTIIQGVEFDKDGKRFGYHLYETHPGSSLATAKSNFVPVEEVEHIFKPERPGQVRGVPWLAPVMIRLKDLDDFEDAQLMRQKVAACFTAFVQDISADADCEEMTDLGEKIEPALIEYLPPGKTVTFAEPPTVENYKEFTSAQQRAIAAGYGTSYEAMTGDLSETNYSSARMGWIEFSRNIETWREMIIIQKLMNRATGDFMFMMEILNGSTSGVEFKHIAPKREMIDPTKEIPAMIKKIRAGLGSRSSAVASLGEDIDEVNKEISSDNEKADELNLILDSDPRRTGINGNLQDTETNSDEN